MREVSDDMGGDFAASGALVTGAAGFIGSRLVARLLSAGARVRGVDSFDPYYARALKEHNLAGSLGHPNFELFEQDVSAVDLRPLLEDVRYVFHLAAQAGVRGSWSGGFDHYVACNILATQRLLEALRTTDIRRCVYASSSSVYGDVPQPVTEASDTRPRSPYGVTKLAGEHLCGVYAREFGVPCVSLRYFTVFGPGQRPDMAIHRMVEAALGDTSFPLYGDGKAKRDFTFVDDVVEATVLAARAELEPGEVFNVGGGKSRSMASVLDDVGEAVGRPVQIERREPQAGDVEITGAITDRAQHRLGWAPAAEWLAAIRSQVAWHRARPAGTRDTSGGSPTDPEETA